MESKFNFKLLLIFVFLIFNFVEYAQNVSGNQFVMDCTQLCISANLKSKYADDIKRELAECYGLDCSYDTFNEQRFFKDSISLKIDFDILCYFLYHCFSKGDYFISDFIYDVKLNIVTSLNLFNIINKRIYYKFIAKSCSVKYSEFFDEKGRYKSIIKNYNCLVKLNKSKNEYIIEYQLIIKIYNLNKEKVCEYEINFPLIEKTSPLIDNK
jgi:hypothetical protein